MGRGSIVVIALPGDYGKPRPGLVIQSDAFEASTTVAVLPLTSDRSGPIGIRVDIDPSPESGLRIGSRVMIDKPGIVARSKIGPTIGRLSDEQMAAVDRNLALFLGFG